MHRTTSLLLDVLIHTCIASIFILPQLSLLVRESILLYFSLKRLYISFIVYLRPSNIYDSDGVLRLRYDSVLQKRLD